MMVGVLIVIFLGIFIGLVALAAKQARKSVAIVQATRERISNDYETNEIYVSAIDGGLLAISFSRKKLVLGGMRGEHEYAFEQIAKVEVSENGTTTTQTDRGSQFVGAAVGGLVFGGVGAIIGGLSGSTRAKSRIVELSLKVWVDDQFDPLHEIRFFRAPNRRGVDPRNLLLRPAKEAVERIHAHLLNAMRQAEKLSRAPVIEAGVDQLHKLFEMKQAGALTEAEFNDQKTQLLNSPPGVQRLAPPPVSRFDVVLISGGARPINVIKALRVMGPGLGLKEAMEMVRSLPSTILRDVTNSSAEDAKRVMIAAGAIVEIRPR